MQLPCSQKFIMMQFAIIERKMAAKPADFPPDQRDEPRLHQLKEDDNFWCDYFLKKYRNQATKNTDFFKYDALWLIASPNKKKTNTLNQRLNFFPRFFCSFLPLIFTSCTFIVSVCPELSSSRVTSS